MRPTVAANRDPLDADGLPPTDGMNLELRVATRPQLAMHWAFTVALVCLGAFGLTFVLKLLVLYAGDVRFLLYAAFGASVLALLYFCLVTSEFFIHGAVDLAQQTRTPPSFTRFRDSTSGCLFLIVSFLVLIWLASKLLGGVTSSLANRIFFFLAAVAALGPFADAVCTQHVAWLGANPFVSDTSKRRIRAAWKRRFENPKELLSPAIAETSFARVGDYRLGFLLLLAVTITTLVITSVYRGPLPGVILVFVFTLLLLFVGGVYAGLGAKPLFAVSEAYRSVVGWLTYDPGDTDAPGAFRSPRGTHRARVALFLFALFVLGVSASSLGSYYPVSFLFGDRTRWAEMYDQTWPLHDETPTPQPRVSPEDKNFLDKIAPRERGRYQELLIAKKREDAGRAHMHAALRELDQTPEAWLFTAFKGVLKLETNFMLAVLISAALAVLVVPLMMFGVLLLVGGRVLPLAVSELYGDPTKRYSNADEWDAIVSKIQSSRFAASDIRERDHLWLGYNAEYVYPVLLDRRILHEHAHIMGDSGSGKTALALAPMISQLIRLSGRLNDSKEQAGQATNPSDSISLLVIDLKGDRSLFENTRIEAKRAGLPFRWFTNRREHATYGFNPFLQKHVQNALTVNQRTEVLIQALGLQYGEFYGGGYFSSINQTVLRRFLKKYSDEIHSFQDLAAKAESPADYQATFQHAGGKRTAGRRMKEWQDAAHLFARIDALASLPSVNVTPKNAPTVAVAENQIDLGQLLDAPGVVYFNLSSITETVAVQGVAKLALYSLLTAADLREPNSTARVYCFIDEFQQVAADNLELILRQARSKNVACILANQAMTDLRTKDGNLMHTVEANTAFKQVFRAGGHDHRERLANGSGETIYELFSVSERSDGEASISFREEIGPRFRPNDILAASYEPNTSLVHISRPSGFTRFGGQLFALHSEFHIEEERYRMRESSPWPEPNEQNGTFRAIDLETHWAEQHAHEPVSPPAANCPPHSQNTDKAPAHLDQAIQSFLLDFEDQADA